MNSLSMLNIHFKLDINPLMRIYSQSWLFWKKIQCQNALKKIVIDLKLVTLHKHSESTDQRDKNQISHWKRSKVCHKCSTVGIESAEMNQTKIVQ